MVLSLFSLAIVYAVANSFINYENVILKFEELGYPPYLIFVLGTAQLLGLSVLILNKTAWIREWAYTVFCIIALDVTYVQNKILTRKVTYLQKKYKLNLR
ncbi:hypothetical protein D9O36_12985 [Zobellia amurskyensis]|uniref:DoxX-like protein n=1 Tax=Zobellia amurskyensis TaxID=248905 RepID=A0A7X2ZUR6_9FLAO|nr:hypothetical protein [Zobellia amurskyensis]